MTSESGAGVRARASRRYGARSRRPTAAPGKARAARNPLKHGLRARRMVLLDDEDAAAFAALETALRTELAPDGALQADLVARIASADRLEAALPGRHLAGAGPGLGNDRWNRSASWCLPPTSPAASPPPGTKRTRETASF